MTHAAATRIDLMNLGRKPALKLLFTLVQPTDIGQPNLAEFDRDALAAQIAALTALDDRTPSPLIAELGDGILAQLGHHANLGTALAYAIQASSASPRPIHVVLPDLDREAAESVPWEVVRHPSGLFLGLEDRCPVARIVRSRGSAAAGEEVLDGALRVVAVLGASDMPTRTELAALTSALSGWGMAFKALFLLDAADLAEEVNGGGDPRFRAELTPPTAAELTDRVAREGPHLFHVLGHGTAEGGGRIEIATRLSHAGGEPVSLAAPQLARAAGRAWLVTLDACLCAAPGSDTSSLAADLMAEGVRAVVAMREPVRFDIASDFTRALWTEIGATLRGVLQPGRQATVYWGSVVTRARQALPHGRNPGACKSWTLPVLYLQPQPLVVNVPAAPPCDAEAADRLLRDLATIAELERQAEALRPVRPELMPAIEARIAEIRARLLGG